MGIWIFWILSFLIPLVLQFLLLQLTQSRLRLRFLRWFVPLGTVGFLVNAWQLWQTPTFFRAE